LPLFKLFFRVRRRILLVINLLVVVWLLLAILGMNIPPHRFWPAGFIALSMPVPVVLNILFFFFWGLYRPVLALLPAAVVALTWGYHTRILALNLRPGTEPQDQAKSFSVMSYNVRVFNRYEFERKEDRVQSRQIIDWVAEHPADIFCVQEYYNEDKSTIYNATSKIVRTPRKHIFQSTIYVNAKGAEYAMAIISKYPIIGKGTINFGKLTLNHAMFADIKVKADTLRVYNFHFQSMSIKNQDLLDTYYENALFEPPGRKIARRLKDGFVERSQQVNTLLDHLRTSPYPVVICGDLNDLPFSYTYEKLNDHLSSSFVASGRGIGTTYNGLLPFLRIDGQFFDHDRLQIHNFKIYPEVPYSDHFPNAAVYSFH
jgi:endonuclease/exonuclease/phosphatase family metal-dependent hydrolase